MVEQVVLEERLAPARNLRFTSFEKTEDAGRAARIDARTFSGNSLSEARRIALAALGELELQLRSLPGTSDGTPLPQARLLAARGPHSVILPQRRAILAMKAFLTLVLFAFVAAGSAHAQCTPTLDFIFRPQCYTASGSGNTLVSQADAAFNAAAAIVAAGTNQAGATVELGNVLWPICNNQQGWVQPQNTGGNGAVSIHGAGALSAFLNVSCTIHRTALPTGAQSGQPVSQAALWCPVYTTPAQNTVQWEGFGIFANGAATLAVDEECYLASPVFRDLTFSGGAGDGTALSAVARFGNNSYASQSWIFQAQFEDISINGGPQGSGATFTASVNSGTGVPTVTITAGGSGYSANTVVYLDLCPASLGSTPQRLSVTVNGSGTITAVTNPNSYTFYACSSNVYAHAFDPTYPTHYGIVLDHVSDSTFINVLPQTGTWAAMISTGVQDGSNTFIKVHPCCGGIPVGIQDVACNNTYDHTEMDTIGLAGFVLYGCADPSIVQTEWLWAVTKSGATEYFLATGTNASIINGHCDAGLENTAAGAQQFSFNFGTSTRGAATLILGEQECENTLHTPVNVIPGTLTATVGTLANCASSASPAACAAAAAGSVAIASGSTSVVVNTTAVTASSQIIVGSDASLGSRLGVICNSANPAPYVSARTPGTSFTVSLPTAPATNPACLSYALVN